MTNTEKLRACQELYKFDPVSFFRRVLSFEPDPWQADAAFDLAHNRFVSVKSGQGVGKTAFQAASLLWFLACFPFSRVVATAPTRQQLSDVLWAEAAKWISRCSMLSDLFSWNKSYIYINGFQNQWFAAARTAAKPENLQGFHADNLLFIVDEASGVPDSIFEPIFGTLSGDNNKLLLCGNPTRPYGTFFDSHNSDAALFKTHSVSSLDSSRTNKDLIDALIHKFGRDSNLVRVRVFGQFPICEDDVFIPADLALSSVCSAPPAPPVLSIDLGVDVARFGSDSTVIAAKVNNSILPLSVSHGADTSTTAELAVFTARSLALKHRFDGKVFIKIDDTGVGGGVTDAIFKILRLDSSISNITVVPVNFASHVSHPYFSDFNTFLWGNLKDLLVNHLISLPDDPILISELSSRKKSFSAVGKIQIESKRDMKKRGLDSPDRADAAALAALPVLNQGGNFIRKEGRRRA